MTLQELLKKYSLEDDKIEEFINEMKTNRIYVSSEENMDIRFKKLQDDFTTKEKELQKAQELIEELKTDGSSNDETLKKIAELQEENARLKIDSALQVALEKAKVTNVDFIAFKIGQDLKASDKELELDENGHIKGIDEIIEKQKKAEPEFFAAEIKKEVDVKELGGGKENEGEPEPENLLDALKQKYQPKTDI